jgi:hypothetical protein
MCDSLSSGSAVLIKFSRRGPYFFSASSHSCIIPLFDISTRKYMLVTRRAKERRVSSLEQVERGIERGVALTLYFVCVVPQLRVGALGGVAVYSDNGQRAKHLSLARIKIS